MLRRRRHPDRDDGHQEHKAPEAAPAPAEADVDHLTRDPLTGTVAPWLFEDRLALMAQRLRRSRRLGALLVVDVDRLDTVNDALGHGAGDELLQAIADRIGGRLRDGDTLARIAGDEFAVLVDELAGPDDAGTVAESILEVLRSPFRLGADTAMVSVSIGVVSVDGEEPVAELRRRAELALARAKHRGGARWAAFEGRTAPAVDRRLHVEWALRSRLDGGEVRFRYRPVADLRSGALALVRSTLVTEWHEVGLVSPDEVRAAAAATGLAEHLLRVEISAAATASTAWPAEVPAVVGVPLPLLASGRAADIVDRAWGRSGGDEGGLVLLVEDAAGPPPAPAAEQLDRLRDRGARVALDLAGGAVSLDTLRTLPADLLVLDGSLLSDLASDRSRAVAGAVLGVAEVLGATVVAGGVDDSALLTAARSIGVDLVHGDRVGPPVDAAELAPWFGAATARG